MASKMSALMDLVSQNQPQFKTQQGLLVIGLQNDFILPEGRLPVKTQYGFLDRIQTLIPKFRELNGNVIWVQTLYETDRLANDSNMGEGDALVVGGLVDGEESGTEAGDDESAKDIPPTQSKSSKHKQRALDLLKRVSARRKAIPREVARASAEQDDELFLLRSENKTPACVPDTAGAEFADVIARQFELPADIVVRTTNYSAFQGTSLLMTLRAKLVTELYICGCITNVSVLATVIDAARHGIKINVIEDCLGFRKQARHDLALKRMVEFFDAYLVNSTDILSRTPPATPQKLPKSPKLANGSRSTSRDGDKPIESLVNKLSLNDSDSRPVSRTQSPRPSPKVLSGKQRTLSLVSVAESRKAAGPSVHSVPEPTDEQFAARLERGAEIPGVEPHQETEKKERHLVKTKIRMRSKGKKKNGKPESPNESTVPIDATAESSTPSRGCKADPPSIAATATSTAKNSTNAPEPKRTSWIAKAESTLSLREKDVRQQPLKSIASQPALAGKEKEKDKLSDRMRLSLTKTSKSELPDSKKRLSNTSAKVPPTPTKITSESLSIATEALSPTSEVVTTGLEQSDLSCQPLQPLPTPTTIVLEQSTMIKPSKLQSLATLPVLGPGDKIAEGDSRIIHDFFAPDTYHSTLTSGSLSDIVFAQLYNEITWQKMLHQTGEVPRLVCCQGQFGDDGSMPVYRHPTDQTLPLLHFSPMVEVVKKQAEKLVGHPLNHVLIQLYRSGNDYISEHSDKTLDIAKGSSIVNVSFGAQRTMRLRTKKDLNHDERPAAEDYASLAAVRETQRVAMPHNSMFVLGLATNERWLHGIMADKRLPAERSAPEIAYGGMRISLTFRNIGTFLDAKETIIWGQGATAKSQRDAADVINGDKDESERMIRAFGQENHSAAFSWDKFYGPGFDVLHLHDAPEDVPLLFASHGFSETKQVLLCLSELKVKYRLVDAPVLDHEYAKSCRTTFRDNDALHTEIEGATAILLYLDRYFTLDRDERSRPCSAAAYSLLPAMSLLATASGDIRSMDQAAVNKILTILNDRLLSTNHVFIAGSRFSIVDCLAWPLIDALVEHWAGWTVEEYPALDSYYTGLWKKKASVKKIRPELLSRKERKDIDQPANASK